MILPLKTPIDNEVKSVLEEVESSLNDLVSSDDDKLTAAAKEILLAGGKRLRPALVFISGGLEKKEELMPVAVAVEAVHMASLIHDDLIDKTELRRGKPTVNSKYGKEAAITVGDYIFARAFEKIAETDNPQAVTILAKASIDLTMGEILQQKTVYNPNQTESFYLSKIKFKTASLFEASCKISAIVSGKDKKEVEALSLYGLNIGFAFQIYDDILDISGSEKELGKQTGTDLYDGIMTLPYIYASDEPNLRKKISAVMKKSDPSSQEIETVIEAIKNTDAIERSKKRAENFIKYAITCLENIDDKLLIEKLSNIASFVIDRYN